MKILFVFPWHLSVESYNPTESPNTYFGFYSLAKKGVDITCCSPNMNNPIVKKLFMINPHVIGVILTQIGCLRKARKYDVIYVGYDMHLLFLSLAKALGLCRTPIFVLSHFTYNSNYTSKRWKKLLIKVERWLCFNFIERMSFASPQLLKNATGGVK